jgi:hypothetical protein
VGFVIDYLISLPPLSFRDILDLIQTIGLIIVLWITFVQLRKTIKSNRAFASLQITTSHREIWSHLLTDESLERIVKENVDLEKEPITKKEGYFVIMVVNHMSAVYDAYRQGIHEFIQLICRNSLNFQFRTRCGMKLNLIKLKSLSILSRNCRVKR